MHLHQLVHIFRFNKLFWVVLCFLAIANLFFHFLAITQQRMKIDALQINYRKSRALSSTNSDQIYRKLDSAQKDLHAFKAQLPGNSQFADIVIGLFEAIHNQGLTIGKMSYKTETIVAEGLLKYTTSFIVTGSYLGLKTFLADIQNSKDLLCIEHISFANRSADKEVIDMKLTLATYFK